MSDTQTIYHSPYESSAASDSTQKSSCKKEASAELLTMTLSQYLDPRNDVAFKKIFGSEKNKDLVIHFLNDLVVLSQGRRVKTVSFLPCVQDAEIAALKQSVVDILCLDERGEQYIIEMQYAPLDGFIERAQHYASRAYSNQIERGEKSYKNIKKVIFIAITNVILFPEEEDYKSRHDMRHDKSLKNYLDGMTFYFVELPKFKNTISELLTLEEKWLFFLKHATETTAEDVDKISGNDEIIHQAYEALDRFSWSKEELLAYQQNEKRILDLQAAFDYQRLEGKIEGRAEGKAEKAREMALCLLENGIPVSLIISASGLSEEEIRSVL